MTADEKGEGRYASPPCMAGEVAPDYFDPIAVDPAQARDVARWRRAERERQRNDRQALSVEARARIATALVGHLHEFLAARFDGARGLVFSGYWPIKGEPDLRPVMRALHEAGVTVVLPVVETRGAPLVFRRWSPDTKMVRGDWNIPVPPPEAERLHPDIALAPFLGWDAGSYRLGYGGGYFDRTLAALLPRPFAIGIGLQSARLATIYPQPHDIALDVILTEAGVQAAKETSR